METGQIQSVSLAMVVMMQWAGESRVQGPAPLHWHHCKKQRPGSVAVLGQAAAVSRPLSRKPPGPSPMAGPSHAPHLLPQGMCPTQLTITSVSAPCGAPAA